jgi:hypothetical protein
MNPLDAASMVIRMKTFKPIALAISASIVLFGCGGGGGGGNSTPPATQNQSPAGIWSTSYTVTSGPNIGDTIKALAFVSVTNEFYFAAVNQNNGCATVGFGQGSVSGSTISASEVGAVVRFSNIPGINVNCAFPDGSTTASASITGTVSTGQTLVITGSGMTAGGTALPSNTVTYVYDSLSNVPPSFATVAGNYTTVDGSTLSISNSGAISELNITTGCTMSGQLTIQSGSYNIYNVSVSMSSCAQAYSTYDGLSMSGLAAYDNSVTPNEIDFGLSGTLGGQFFVLATALPK